MFCNVCGAQLPEGSVFCSNCGNNLTASSVNANQANFRSQYGEAQPMQGYAQPQNTYYQPAQNYSQPNQGYAQPQNGYNQPVQGYNPAVAPQPGVMAQPMGWYKFLIYFALFAGAVINAITAVMMFSGVSYESAGASAELVYAVLPDLKGIDMTFAVLLLISSVILVCTRFQLSGYKKPHLL